MAEIDFDELDRAVNNLMGNLKGTPEDVPKSNEKVLKIESTLPVDEKPVQNTPPEPPKEPEEKKPELKTTPTERPQRTTVPPRPASGRFMDLVHPSGDMRSKPTAPMVTKSSKVMEPVVKTEEVKTAQVEPTTDDLVNDEPPLTPFLPDANEKVQKRPLGSAPVEPSDEVAEVELEDVEPEIEETEPINSEYSKEKKVDKEDEKGQDQRPLDPEDFHELTEEEKALQAIESAEVIVEPAAVEADDSVRTVESGDTEHLRGGDEPNKHDKDADTEKAGAIYDTKAYHQPLGQTKQKSGWGTIIIIVLVIVICVGSAVAAFLFLGGFR